MRIRLERLTKRFGSVVAVKDLTLEVADGEFLVLLGSSGCGKTTTLRMIAGLEEPDAGEIWLGERQSTHLPPRARDVAMVFQSYALYPHLTLAENIGFPLRVRKVAAAEAARQVRQAAAKLGLETLLERRPRELSGGQRQRVALARAIVRQPNAFLMDEPLSNLDAQLRLQTRGELKRLQHELGVTTVYVTHDQSEAMTLAHRVAVMEGGVLQQLDTPANVYNHPSNRFVAGFLGSPPMNFLTGRVDLASHALSFDGMGDTGLAWPLEVSALSRLGQRLGTRSEAVMGLRPENVEISTEPRNGWMPARVYVSEPVGHESIVMVKIGRQMVTARVSSSLQLNYDQPVWVRAATERTYFFDPQTGSAI